MNPPLQFFLQGSTSKEILDVVAHGISNHAELWNRYFSDFVLHKLQLDSEDSSGIIAQKILHTTLMHQLHSLDALKRLVFLHTYLHVYQLDLARMAANLRPLSKLKEVSYFSIYVMKVFLHNINMYVRILSNILGNYIPPECVK